MEVHIAGVADVVGLGSVADEQAFLRAETRYLRNRTIPMLGETAEQAATLTAESVRTSLRVTGTITTDGRLVHTVVGRGEIPSGRCVTVDHAEVLVRNENGRPSTADLRLREGADHQDPRLHQRM